MLKVLKLIAGDFVIDACPVNKRCKEEVSTIKDGVCRHVHG